MSDDPVARLLDEAEAFVRLRKEGMDFPSVVIVEKLAKALRFHASQANAWRSALSAALLQIEETLRAGGRVL